MMMTAASRRAVPLLEELLPPHSREILHRLREHADAAAGAVHGATVSLSRARDEREAAHSALKSLRAPTEAGGMSRVSIPETEQIVVEAKARVERAEEAYARAEARYAAAGGAQQAALAPVAIAENYLRRFYDHEAIPGYDNEGSAKPRKGETLETAVERHRQRILELQADLRSVQAALLPPSLAKEQARRQIAALAARGAPDVSRLVEVDINAPIRWPKDRENEITARGVAHGDKSLVTVTGSATTIDALAVLAWLFEEQIAEKIDREIDEICEGAVPLTAEERAEREAALRTEILKVERDEADLVNQSDGKIAHRPDVDPRALLGLADEPPGE